MYYSLKFFKHLFFLFGILFFVSSCVSSKKVVYFNDLTLADSAALITAQTQFENTIKKNDQLAIIFGGTNPQDLGTFNSASGGSIVGGVSGYLVEADGNIKLPLIGKIKVEGLSRLQLEDTLTTLLKGYTKNPVVNVRFTNYSYSVLGEVGRAGRFPMLIERTTILDAISSAGDLTLLAKRENILVIREEDGKRTVGRVNLLSKEIFKSPFFYMKTNDLIYVEPINAKLIARSGITQYIPFLTLGLSVLLVVINLRR